MSDSPATTSEVLPADIACAAAANIMAGMTVADATFFAAVEATNACHDRAWARAYGLAHWADLSDRARSAWDWVYGRETRLRRFW